MRCTLAAAVLSALGLQLPFATDGADAGLVRQYRCGDADAAMAHVVT